jgi:hypothetical protein
MTLRWFGSWKKTDWKVGTAREAYADRRGGRYQIRRHADGFVVRWCPPHNPVAQPWQEIRTVATPTEAVAVAQAHNEQGSA